MKRLMLAMIRFYRRNLSRRKKHPTCRYIPTCSEYAVTAIERYGALKGGLAGAPVQPLQQGRLRSGAGRPRHYFKEGITLYE